MNAASVKIETWRTARLVAQRLGPQHRADIGRLHSDRAVMRTLSADGQPLTDDQTASGLEKAVGHWGRHSFGLWAFYRRQDRAFIGRGGLHHYRLEDLDDPDQIGLAYAVLSPHWGLGLATEMATGILQRAFADLALGQVASWTLPDNKASQRILAKLGFAYQRDFVFAGLRHRFYLIAKDDFATQAVPCR